MNTFTKKLKNLSKLPIPILDEEIPILKYIPMNLSVSNVKLETLDITDPNVCETYIDAYLRSKSGVVAYGGYLEKRNLYADKKGFNSNKEIQRNIHLGVDYWCAAGTKVLTPIQGKVHSFKDNAIVGDYGPTIILEHNLAGERFYTLYGHLSRASLDSLYIGKTFTAGTVLGYLGTADINVNYAPHLHFQVIRDVQGNIGDYPGVCSQDNLAFYQENCPDPNLLLKIA